jgi:hypothetical protein
MAIESIEAALRAAGLYLSQMRDQEGRAFGDKSNFDQSLTSFVGAGRSVVFQLERKYASTYRDWREAWNAEHKDEDRLLKAMHDRRDANVHEGSHLGHNNIPEQIKVGSGSFYSDKSGTLQNFSCPSPLLDADLSVTIHKPRYFFGDQPVLQACEQYLTVLEQMVGDFETYLNSRTRAA